MNVLPATPDDAPAILALQLLAYATEAAIYDDHSLPPLLDTLDDLTACFDTRQFLKVTDGDHIVGSVRAYQDGDTCFVERLIVHPDYRRRGIGTELMKRVEKLFPDARRMELFTGSKSEANFRMYARLGYRPFRQEQICNKITLVFLEKSIPRLGIRLDRLELIAATAELLEAEEDREGLARSLRADVSDNWPMPLYDDDARKFFRRILHADREAVGWTSWYILLCHENRKKTLIGAVGACGAPDQEGNITIGYSLLDQFHGHGYATKALRGFLDWARRDSRLRKVVADTFSHLGASIRVLEKNGFVQCGEGGDEGSIRFELSVL